MSQRVSAGGYNRTAQYYVSEPSQTGLGSWALLLSQDWPLAKGLLEASTLPVSLGSLSKQ